MSDDMLFSIKLSIQVACVATLGTTLCGGILGYILAQKTRRAKILLDIFIMLPVMLPPTVIGYYLILLFGRNSGLGRLIFSLTGWNIMFTWWACVVASFIVSLPLMAKAVESAIRAIDKSVIEASYILGYSKLETFFRIILPIGKGGIFSGIMLAFVRSLGEFGATLMLAGNIPGKTNTLPLTIYSLVASGDYVKVHYLVLTLTLISAFFILVMCYLNKQKY